MAPKKTQASDRSFPVQCAQPAPSTKAAPAAPAIVTARKREPLVLTSDDDEVEDGPPAKRQAGAARIADLDTAYRQRKAPVAKAVAKAPTKAAGRAARAPTKGPLGAKGPTPKQPRPKRGAAKQARRALAALQNAFQEEPSGESSEHTARTVSSPAIGDFANLLRLRLPSPPLPLAYSPPLQREAIPTALPGAVLAPLRAAAPLAAAVDSEGSDTVAFMEQMETLWQQFRNHEQRQRASFAVGVEEIKREVQGGCLAVCNQTQEQAQTIKANTTATVKRHMDAADAKVRQQVLGNSTGTLAHHNRCVS